MSTERARLFVGLELPADARAALVQWRSGHLPDGVGLRRIEPDALHATLCFLGWRPTAEIDQIAAACSGVECLPGVELALGASVWLPARHPRVLAVELRDAHGGLSLVQRTLSDALQAGGWYEPEARPFLAHVTVARIGKGERMRRVELPPPPPLTLRGSLMTLFRSLLGPGGARYERLRQIQLSGEPGGQGS